MKNCRTGSTPSDRSSGPRAILDIVTSRARSIPTANRGLRARRGLRFGVKTKVLIPLLLNLALVPAIFGIFLGNVGLGTLDASQRELAAAIVACLLVSAISVGLLVQALARFLRELRDKMDAVSLGNFSRCFTRLANDECGDVAEAFNHMTACLLRSRVALEKAAESLADTQAQLMQSEKLSGVGQFVSGVAHELNNPLTIVIGFSDLLLETQTDEKIRTRLEMITKSAHRCHRIVENLLGFARQQPPDRRQIQVVGVIDEVLELMAYDLKTSNIEVVQDIPKGLPPITADAHQIQQVFVNIVGNARQAIQAFRPHGRIVVRARARAGYVRVEIADDGPGIKPEDIRRIFDPFFTTKPVGKGTGLGLSLVFQIIHEHAGHIDVVSEVGSGATFILEFPIAAEPAHSRREAVLMPVRPLGLDRRPGTSGKMILVVDDEEWIRTLARELLGDHGHAVELAPSGEAAVAAIRSRKFDAIVCDWKMPGMSGIEFYERLLEDRPELAEHVLFMSGDSIDEKFQAFLRRHERKCLAKPFPIEEFRGAVEQMLFAA